jgi:phosphate/sulfate permease
MDHVDRERARSLRFVQIAFASLALLSLFAAIIVALSGTELGLPDTSVHTIAFAFLIVGIMDTAVLFLWERIFSRIQQ